MEYFIKRFCEVNPSWSDLIKDLNVKVGRNHISNLKFRAIIADYHVHGPSVCQEFGHCHDNSHHHVTSPRKT